MSTPQPNTSPDTSDVLIDFISAFFVPMFLADSKGDITLARLAAVETMNAYHRIHDQADLLAVAQIIAFGIATLSSLSLSMADDISLSMVLRLRGNANACNRSAERSRRTLHASHQAEEYAAPPDRPTPQARPPAPAPQQPASPAAPPAASSITDQERRAWAAACAQVAEEYNAELPNLPPEEQKLAAIRVTALNDSASAFLAGAGRPAATPYPQGRAVKPSGI